MASVMSAPPLTPLQPASKFVLTITSRLDMDRVLQLALAVRVSSVSFAFSVQAPSVWNVPTVLI